MFLFFFCSVYFTDVSHLLCAHERLDHDKEFILKKCQKFSAYLIKLNVKIFCLKHHQHFLKKHDDKLIQKSMKIFEEKLHVLKKKQNFIISSNISFSDL